jgi:hypothetical protein
MTQSQLRKVVLADNDIIHKLACCGLLQELLQWLGVPPVEVWVLPSMKYVVRPKLKGNQAALSELERFLSQVSNLPEADIHMLGRFPREMDVGERQMLAILVNTPEVQHMVTGDKRALRLIGGLCSEDSALDERLGEVQVDCLESIMLALIDKYGFEPINVKASLGLKSDVVLQASFGAKKSAGNAREALIFYLNDVRSEAPFLTSF